VTSIKTRVLLEGPTFNEVEKGGHFAAWEEPQLFAEELRAAFRSLR
jgi:pimeloyl-ACP methyl ester carboxylesterase